MFFKCCECKYAPIGLDCHVALLHLQPFKINQKCLRTYMLCYSPHLNLFVLFFCVYCLYFLTWHEGTNKCIHRNSPASAAGFWRSRPFIMESTWTQTCWVMQFKCILQHDYIFSFLAMCLMLSLFRKKHAIFCWV